jgi:hypothetical protein
MNQQTRRVPGWVGLVSLVGLVTIIWRHPEFGPPILAGFSIGFVGLVVGCLVGIALVGYQWVRRSRRTTRRRWQ